MATVPSPRTWTVGELLTAAKMNTDVRDGLNFLLSGKPFCHLAQTLAVELSYGASMPFASEVIDRDNGHSTSTNNSRYTAQTAGWYHVTAAAQFTDEFTVGEDRTLRLTHMSGVTTMATYDASTTSSGQGAKSSLSLSGYFSMAVNDYIRTDILFSDSSEEYFVFGQMTIEWVSKRT